MVSAFRRIFLTRFHLSLLSTYHQNISIWRRNEPEWWVKHSFCLGGFGWLSIKVKLITDGCQRWSHILPGAGGSHFESFLKLWRRRLHMWISHRLAQAIVITRWASSFVFNVSVNRRSPAILFLYPRDTYLWSLVLLCEHLQLIIWALLTSNLESRCSAI